MIEFKCDICGKQERNLNTIVFYRKKLDYCNNKKCIKTALKLMKAFEREVKAQNIMYNCILKTKENKLLKNFKKSNIENTKF